MGAPGCCNLISVYPRPSCVCRLIWSRACDLGAGIVGGMLAFSLIPDPRLDTASNMCSRFPNMCSLFLPLRSLVKYPSCSVHSIRESHLLRMLAVECFSTRSHFLRLSAGGPCCCIVLVLLIAHRCLYMHWNACSSNSCNAGQTRATRSSACQVEQGSHEQAPRTSDPQCLRVHMGMWPSLLLGCQSPWQQCLVRSCTMGRPSSTGQAT